MARGLRLGPRFAEVGIQAFEAQAGVRLPEEFRQFLQEVGDGSPDGPPAFGLRPLRQMAADLEGSPLACTRPFPLVEEWIWEDEPDADPERLQAVREDGHLFLGTDGCAMDWLLIVTGPERGRVWNRADVGSQPCCPAQDFLGWYECWLDGGDYWSGYD